MKSKQILQKIGVYLLKSMFYLLCFLIFLRMTFPLDDLKVLVSKWIQNRYQVEFSVDLVSFSGLAGLSLQGINVVQSPTEEQKKAMQDYLKALKQQNEEKAEREKLEKEEKAKAKKDKKKAKKDKDKKEEGSETATATATEDLKDAKDKEPKEIKEEKLERPKMPSPMSISELNVQFDFWSLLFSQKLNLQTSAKISEGSLLADLQENAENELEVHLEAKDLSLVALGPVLDLSPMPLLATLNVNAKLTIPKSESQNQLKYDETNGQMTFKLTELKSKAFSVQNEMAGVLDIPALNIGTLGGQIEFARKRASFVDFKLGDQDFEGFLTGHFDLAPKIENTVANTHVHLQLNIDFIKKTPLVSTMATLEKKYFQKEPDGAYLIGFLIKGKVSKLKTQPKIYSPFSREGRQNEKEDVKNNPNPNIKPNANPLPTTPVISNEKPSLPPPPLRAPKPAAKTDAMSPPPAMPAKPIQFPSMKNNAEIDAPSVTEPVEAPQEEVPATPQDTEDNKSDDKEDENKEDENKEDENKEDENKGIEGIEIE